MGSPLVSVILPAFNAERTLLQAISSVLNQSFADFELLVVDDGSTDGTANVLKSVRDPRLRVITQPVNRGLIATLNLAVSEARGALIARQDADDVSLPRRLELQVSELRAHPEVGAVGAELELMDDDGHRAGTWTYPPTAGLCRWQLLFKTPVAHSVVMFRRDCVEQAGGYSPQYKYAEDYELWSRLARITSFSNLPLALLRYSIGAAGTSRQNSANQQEVHLRIASQNMAAVLGHDVPSRSVYLLAAATDMGVERATAEEIRGAAEVCANLYRRFAQKAENRLDDSAIRRAFVDKMIRLARLLPMRERINCLRQLQQLSPVPLIAAAMLRLVTPREILSLLSGKSR